MFFNDHKKTMFTHLSVLSIRVSALGDTKCDHSLKKNSHYYNEEIPAFAAGAPRTRSGNNRAHFGNDPMQFATICSKLFSD